MLDKNNARIFTILKARMVKQIGTKKQRVRETSPAKAGFVVY